MKSALMRRSAVILDSRFHLLSHFVLELTWKLFQDHQNISQRKCSLIQMVEKIRQGWVSGPKFCGINGNEL